MQMYYEEGNITYCLEDCPSNLKYSQNGECVEECVGGWSLTDTTYTCALLESSMKTPSFATAAFIILVFIIIMSTLIGSCVHRRGLKAKKDQNMDAFGDFSACRFCCSCACCCCEYVGEEREERPGRRQIIGVDLRMATNI